MSLKVTLKVSASAASYVRADAAKDEKLRAARREISFSPADLGTILFILSRDPDPDVKGAAVQSLQALPEDMLLPMATSAETHPLVLDALARFHGDDERVAAAILSRTDVDPRTVEYLAAREPAGHDEEPDSGGEFAEDDEPPADDAGSSLPAEFPEEETEEHLSKYKLMQQMSIGEKIKMAMLGDKEWRSLLIKDTNKLVSTAVIKNPRITDPEILAIAKSVELNEEIFRIICMNKDWVKIYQVRKSLVENSKTPLPKALRFLSTLNEKDLLTLSKSKNVSSVISRQAQRIILNKKK